MVMEFVYGADIEIPFSPFPLNFDRMDEWDVFWTCKVRSPQPSDLRSHSDPAWLEQFAKRGYRSILLVGNGISQEPQFFAFAGFRVVAMDISTIATRYASTHSWQEQTLLDSFGIPAHQKVPFLRGMYRFGGSASYTAGDLFDNACCAGPFDVIISRRTLQLYKSPRLDEALIQLHQRLSPEGTMILEVNDDHVVANHMERYLQSRGFVLRNAHTKDSWNAEVLVTSR